MEYMYLTKFSLDILEGHEYDLIQYKKDIELLSGYGSLVFESPVRWYNYNDQMIEYSKNNPSTVFILTGAGTKSADLWRRYYKNGNVQVAEAIITYPEYVDYESGKPTGIINIVEVEPIPEPEKEVEHVTTYEDKQNWWNKLSKTSQDAINHSIFYHEIFELDKAYDTFHEMIQ